MLKLLNTLPSILKYLPVEKAQDARTFILSFQYWLGGTTENQIGRAHVRTPVTS